MGLTDTEKEELEKYRAQRRHKTKYTNRFNEEHYRRLVCMYPIKYSVEVDMAINQSHTKSISAYIAMLITNDLVERGLIKSDEKK